MLKLFLILLFLHLFADFTLQGLFGPLKQKDWWLKEFQKGSTWTTYEGLVRFYGKDYRVANAGHALFWTLITFAPLWLWCESAWWIVGIVGLNAIFHYVVDDLKANAHRINLIHDQLLHLVQIAVTFFIWKGWAI